MTIIAIHDLTPADLARITNNPPRQRQQRHSRPLRKAAANPQPTQPIHATKRHS